MIRISRHPALALALLLIAHPATAQTVNPHPTARGEHWVGLQLGMHSEHLENTTTGFQQVIEGDVSAWNVQAAYGWFVRDNMSIGGGLTYAHESAVQVVDATTGPDLSQESASSTLGLSFLYRNYMGLGDPHFYLYNQTGVSAGYSSGTITQSTGTPVTSELSGRRYALELQPGVAVLVSRGFAVELSVNVLGLIYETERVTTPGQPDQVRTTTSLDFSLSLLQLGLGFTYYF